jgi:hypothetical protein
LCREGRRRRYQRSEVLDAHGGEPARTRPFSGEGFEPPNRRPLFLKTLQGVA